MFSKLNYMILYMTFFCFFHTMKVNRMTIAYISLFLLPIFKLRCVTTDLLFLLHFLCAFLCFSQLDSVYPHSLYKEEQLLFISFVFPSWQKVTMAWNEDNKHRISFSGEAEYQHHFTVIKSCFQIKTATYFRPILDFYRIELYLDVIRKAQQHFNTHPGNTAYLWKPITNFHKGFNLSFDKTWQKGKHNILFLHFPMSCFIFLHKKLKERDFSYSLTLAECKCCSFHEYVWRHQRDLVWINSFF